MPLLDRTGWKVDAWTRHDAWFAAPTILVPAATLPAALEAREEGQRVGVEIANTLHPALLAPVQDQLDLIAVTFPVFGDGRGFSIARLLREQAFAGTLRAVGPVIPDQFAFALQCGFDEMEIGDAQAERQPVGQWLAALTIAPPLARRSAGAA